MSNKRSGGMLKKVPAADCEDATERIRKAAITLFKERGYHGTPVRALASIVNIEAGSLYYHVRSKQQILFDNFARTMDDLLAGLRQAVDSEARPEARLRAGVRFHVLFHIERQSEAFISHAELRALTEQIVGGSLLNATATKRCSANSSPPVSTPVCFGSPTQT